MVEQNKKSRSRLTGAERQQPLFPLVEVDPYDNLESFSDTAKTELRTITQEEFDARVLANIRRASAKRNLIMPIQIVEDMLFSGLTKETTRCEVSKAIQRLRFNGHPIFRDDCGVFLPKDDTQYVRCIEKKALQIKFDLTRLKENVKVAGDERGLSILEEVFAILYG